MKNAWKKGLLVGCAGCGVLSLVLAASPALAREPGSVTVRETGGANPSITQSMNATVVVTAIDKGTRKLTVKMPDGEKKSFKVSEQVKAFDVVKVGDKIDVDYTESWMLSLLPPGSKPSVTERTASIPGAAGRQVSVSAEVVSVDAAANQVTFKTPKGPKTLTVQDPALQARLPEVKPGQVMQLTYTEALATAIVPPAGK